MIIFISLSMLRIIGNYQFYHAPLSLYAKFYDVTPPLVSKDFWNVTKKKYFNQAEYSKRKLTVCIGKEWYRFPSYYFLPSGFEIAFVKSGFAGLLPKHYYQTVADSKKLKDLLRTDFDGYLKYQRNVSRSYHLNVENVNDLNKEELDSYTSVDLCDYYVDTIENDDEILHGFEVYECEPFLDAAKTSRLTRGFYIGEKTWMRYCIFQRGSQSSY
jgi:alpha-1,2-mannosyltransferase